MGGIFLVPVAVVWVVLLVAGAVLPGGPMKALMKLGMLILMGVGISVYGMVTVLRIAKAPRVTAAGVAVNVVVTQGKGAHTKFDLSGPQGALDLHLSYSGANVTEGDEVSVDYVGSGIGNVTRLQMLSGPHRGWSTTADDGTVGAWIAFAVGIVLVLVAFWNNARYPDGVTPGRRWFW